MEFIKIEEAAAKWGLSVRRVQDLCRSGRIFGAKKFGTNWMVPFDAARPVDGRSKEGRAVKEDPSAFQPLVRKSPFLDMTNLYHTPGTADAVIASLSEHPESQQLFAAEIAYSRGEIDRIYAYADRIFELEGGLYRMISGGMLLSLLAMWKGDIQLWQRAKKHIYNASIKNENDRDVVALSIAAADLSIRNTKEFPDWFYRGRFERLPVDAHPAARVFYIKYLLVYAQELAAGQISFENMSGLGLMSALPFIMEPMIAQAVAEKTVMAEIYLRLLCSITYLQTGDKTNASFHLDRAIALCLADRLYGPLVEHRRQLGLFLDERLSLVEPAAARKVKELHKTLHKGWVVLHSAVMENNNMLKLSDRECEVVRFAAFGLSDEQIASWLHITKSSVKSIIQMARNKTGIRAREDFGIYI